MKVSKKELYLLLALVGVIIAICSWQFGFKKINEKTEVLLAETEVLEGEVKKYTAVKDNIDIYQQGIQDATNKIAEVIEKIPADVLPEDAVMLSRELEKYTDHTYSEGVTMSESTVVATATSQPADATAIPISYTLEQNKVTLSHTSSYQGIKDIIDYVYQHKNRMTIESFVLAYDESTGELAGTTVINCYSITGSDKAYVEQNLSGVTTGTNNIFGTMNKKVEE